MTLKFKAETLPSLFKDRVEYLYRFQELIRLYHNQKAQELKDGKITEKEFREFQETWFEPRNQLIGTEIIKCRKAFREKNTLIINTTDIEEAA